jgi:hypothetical protein
VAGVTRLKPSASTSQLGVCGVRVKLGSEADQRLSLGLGGRVGVDHGLCADGARAVGLAPVKGVRYGQSESAALNACRQDDQEMEHLGALRRCELVQGYRPQQRDTQASRLVIINKCNEWYDRRCSNTSAH